MPDAAETFGLAHGYAPSAHKVICVDYDGTLYPFVPIMSSPDPLPGAVYALRRLKEAGYRIVIFTSRLSPRWLAEAGYHSQDQLEHIERQLRRDGIPYDDITSEKVAAAWYVDDRAVRFDANWPEITDLILWRDAP